VESGRAVGIQDAEGSAVRATRLIDSARAHGRDVGRADPADENGRAGTVVADLRRAADAGDAGGVVAVALAVEDLGAARRLAVPRRAVRGRRAAISGGAAVAVLTMTVRAVVAGGASGAVGEAGRIRAAVGVGTVRETVTVVVESVGTDLRRRRNGVRPGGADFARLEVVHEDGVDHSAGGKNREEGCQEVADADFFEEPRRSSTASRAIARAGTERSSPSCRFRVSGKVVPPARRRNFRQRRARGGGCCVPVAPRSLEEPPGAHSTGGDCSSDRCWRQLVRPAAIRTATLPGK